MFLFRSVADKPQLHQLECLKVGEQLLEIIHQLAPKWEKLALHLIPDAEIQIIKADHRYCEASCREMFRRWLAGKMVLKEVTWKGLAEALREMGQGNLAERVEQTLSS